MFISHCTNDEITNNIDKYNSIINTVINEIIDLSSETIFPLNEKNTYIIRKNLGLFDNYNEQTYSSIADELNLSRSTVQQTVRKNYYKLSKSQNLVN